MAAKANTVSTHDFNNYMRLQLIVHISNEPLGHLFVKQWDLTIGKAKWEDTDENRKDFINGPGKQLYQNARPVKKEFMGSRNIKDWDMQLLIQANKCLNVNVSGEVFRELKNLRNKVSYLELEVNDEDFEKYWNDISLLLLELGLSQNDIDEIKSKPIEIKLIEQNILNSKVRSLKDFGNQAFQKGEFKKAVDFYTQAICLSGIPCDEVAMLYSNRSVAFLRLGDIASAKEDAKVSVQLSLTWWKSYYRLAMVHKAEEQYELCLKNLQLCQCFHPNPDNIIEEIVLCNSLIGQKKKEEHFHPMQFCEKDVEFRRISAAVSPMTLLQGCDESSRKALEACHLYDQATRYYTGQHVPQNYEEAAKWYHKAASEGNPEAMYSLAKMYLDGIGVKRDVSKGIKLLEQAASINNLVKIVTYGIEHTEVYRGVAAAQHSLGVLYEQGIGVTKDLTKAKFWYEKAIKSWSGAAANNMAMMCLNGVGVPKSLLSAIQYWKLGAGMDNVKCMENLVDTYFDSGNFVNMQKWYLYAVYNKSEIESDSTRFKKHFRKSVSEDFKPKAFAKTLWREIEKGPLKHLVDPRLKKFFEDDKKSTENLRAAMRKGLF